MYRSRLSLALVVFLFASLTVHAQTEASYLPNAPAVRSDVPGESVPRLVKFSGVLHDADGKPVTGARYVRFALYADQGSATPLWTESQKVVGDESGRYSVTLGATLKGGIPINMFANGEARWLETTVTGEAPQASAPAQRLMLVSVPFALKAEDADKLGGRAATDFVLTSEIEQQVAKVVAQQASKSGQAFYAPDNPIGTTVQDIAPNGAARFQDTSLVEVVLVQQNGTGFGLNVVSINGSAIRAQSLGVGAGNATILGQATSATGSPVGVQGESVGPTGIGVQGVAGNISATNIGVRGEAAGVTGRGVVGAATGTGSTVGVQGAVTSSSGVGVRGEANGTGGTGVLGIAAGTSGNTIGVQGEVNSATGRAGVFRANNSGGKVLVGQGPGPTDVFTVDAGGNVNASGTVTAGGLTTTGTLTVNSVNVPSASSVSGLVKATNSGAGAAVEGMASGANNAGVYGRSTTGTGVGVLGESNTSGGIAGMFNNTAGGKILSGQSNFAEIFSVNGSGNDTVVALQTTPGPGSFNIASPQSTPSAVHGEATTTTGAVVGVMGVTNSSVSTAGIVGVATNVTSTPGNGPTGVAGFTFSDSGSGVYGASLNTTGTAVGVEAEVQSPNAIAGVFTNNAAGQILSGNNGSAEVFSVDGTGTVNALGGLFIGIGGGVIGRDTLNDGNPYVGVQGIVDSNNGRGVVGSAPTSGPGNSIGVLGIGNADNSAGVLGRANSTTGTTSGVRGINFSASGHAVRGDSMSSSLNAAVSGGIGVLGTFGLNQDFTTNTAAANGTGVSGKNFAVNGVGVRAEAFADNGVGVEAAASGTNSGRAVRGNLFSLAGFGVEGVAQNASGSGVGVNGVTNANNSGAGVRAEATTTTGNSVAFTAINNGPGNTANLYNLSTGKILSGNNTGGEVFAVSNSGAVTAAGIIQSTSGGIKFPDNTIQTTAAGGGVSLSSANTWTALQTFNAGADALTLNVGGTYAVSNASNVQQAFTVQGDFGSGSNRLVSFLNTNANGIPSLSIGQGNGGNDAVQLQWDNAAQVGQLAVHGDPIGTGLHVKSGGSVGIGTTTPAALLDVNGFAIVHGGAATGSANEGLSLLRSSTSEVAGLSWHTGGAVNSSNKQWSLQMTDNLASNDLFLLDLTLGGSTLGRGDAAVRFSQGTGNVAFSGTVTATAFVGDGSGLTNLGAAAGTSANTPNTLVARDGSGDFSAGTITATQFSGAIVGSGAGLTNVPNSATTATSANTANTIVSRNASGDFSAGTITATQFSGAIVGSGAGLTNVPNTATTATSTNTANTIVSRNASGDFSAGTITATQFSGAIVGSGAGLTNVPNTATTATSANTANAIVARNASGDFSAGTITASAFVGDGSGLTGINASNTTSLGGVAAANYARLDQGNAFTGAQTVSGASATLMSVSNSQAGGIGLQGQNTAVTGSTFGTVGFVLSDAGTGVIGEADAGSGSTKGVYGLAFSTSGTGVLGEVQATSGSTIGVRGRVESPSGVAGKFETQDPGGSILQGFSNGSQLFAVDGSGNVSATSFSGDGSALTGVVASSASGVALPTTTSSSVGTITLNGNSFIHAFGTNNTFVGSTAGNFGLTGDANTATGAEALQSLTSGVANTATGYGAMRANTSGINNAAFGYQTLSTNTSGGENTAVGMQALQNQTTASNNTAIGSHALRDNINGDRNTGLGGYALFLNTTASDNTAIGYQSLMNNNAFFNTALGANSLRDNSNGSSNLAAGMNALQSNTSGSNNVASGANALLSNTIGNNNTAVGFQAGQTGLPGNANVSGSSNTFIGYNSGPGSESQLTNATAIGANAVVDQDNSLVLGDSAVSVGIGNTAPTEKLDVTGNIKASGTVTANAFVGDGSGLTGISSGISAGSPNTFTADQSFDATLNIAATSSATAGVITQNGTPFIHTFGTSNTFVGKSAGNFTLTGTANVALGDFALFSNTSGVSNSAIGSSALSSNTSGGNNTAVGSSALANSSTGSGNAALGTSALASNTTGGGNVAVGSAALFFNSTSFSNVAVGEQALFNTTGAQNTALGGSTGLTNTTGTNNTFLGFGADASSSGLTNATAIGANAVVSANNSLILGNAANVGIGTSSPTERLDVVGNIKASGSVTATDLVLPAGANITVGGVATSKTDGTLNNYGFGASPLASNTTGVENSAFGRLALFANTTGDDNTAMGHIALSANTTGFNNTAYGAYSLANNVIGNHNTAIGMGALQNTIAGDNTALGFGAGFSNTTGIDNTLIGNNANVGASGLSNATALGAGAVVSQSNALVLGNGADVGIGTSTPTQKLDVVGNVVASGSVTAASFVGDGSGLTGLTGAQTSTANTFTNTQTFSTILNMATTTGASAGVITSGGSRYIHNFGTSNFFAGVNSGNFTLTGSENVGVGVSTLAALTSGSFNTAIGKDALPVATTTTDNTALGWSAMLSTTTGIQNTALGKSSLQTNTIGFENVAVGVNALFNNTTGFENTAIGTNALRGVTTARDNTAIGRQAGYTTTPANAVTTGNFNTFLGYNTGFGSATQFTNATAIGANATVNQSNSLVLGSGANVGIGTSTPSEKLHVVGNILATGTISGNGSSLSNVAAVAGSFTQAQPALTAISTTTLTTPTSAGLYRATCYMVNTSTATGPVGQATIHWTDDSGTAQNGACVSLSSGSLGAFTSGTVIVQSGASAITFDVTSHQSAYKIYISLEKLM